MAADEASDVTKALAAFGAPSIRYRSFGQSAGRPSTIVTPSPFVKAEPPSGRQEPEAASAPPTPVAVATQGPPPSTVPAAPPRPLAEWAPPASAAPAPPAPPSLTAAVPSAGAGREPTHVVVPPMPMPMPRPPPAPSSPIANPAASAPMRSVAASLPVRGAAGRTLAEIFELLASAPSGTSPDAQATPELFRRA